MILRDVKECDMRALLRFIYHGEVQLEESRLADFLKTADTLQIQGLSDGAASAIPMSASDPDEDLEVDDDGADKEEPSGGSNSNTNILRKHRRRRPDPYDDIDADDDKQVKEKFGKQQQHITTRNKIE